MLWQMADDLPGRADMRQASRIATGTAGLGVVARVTSSGALNRSDLHSHCELRRLNLPGRSALVITPSHDTPATPSDNRYLADTDLLERARHSLKTDNGGLARCDLVFVASGWGAAYDLGTSEVLGRKISDSHAAGAILASVCHGARAL